MTSENIKFPIGPEHIKAFNQVKEIVKNSVEIYLPQPDVKKRMFCDSSMEGYACILYDVFEDEFGNETTRIIGFDSKACGSKKFNSSMHFELHAIVSSLLAFRYYLYSTYFKVYTDSESVAQLALGKKNIQNNGVLLGLFQKIMHFDFTIIHDQANTGGNIQVADALSLLRIEKDLEENPETVRPIAY